MHIKVVNVGPKEYAADKKGKKYAFFTLAYKSGNDLRERKIMSFSRDIYEPLFSSKPGDEFDVTVEQKGEFYNWTSLNKEQATASKGNPVPSRMQGSSETDQAKVLSIVRQSAVKSAASALSGNKGVTPEQVIAFADVLVKWCLDQPKLPEEEKIVEGDLGDDDDDEGVE